MISSFGDETTAYIDHGNGQILLVEFLEPAGAPKGQTSQRRLINAGLVGAHRDTGLIRCARHSLAVQQ